MISNSRIDWRQVLISLGFEIPENKEEIVVRCPFHDDRHPSCSINIKKGVWNCFSEGRGGKLVDFLAQLGEIDLTLFVKRGPPSEESKELFFNELTDDEAIGNGEQEEKQVPFISTNYPQWILDRGFTKEILIDWNCVVNNDTQSLIIPIKNQYNKCIGWVARKAPEGKPPKYLYSSGTKISHVLFGLWQYRFPTQFLCLVEGPLDAMWLAQHKLPAVALGGAHLSETQEKILLSLPLTEVVLCFDNDKAGRIVDEDAKKRLNKYFVLSRIDFDATKYKDVQDIRDQQILMETIANRKLAW